MKTISVAQRAQVSMEYAIIFAVMLAAIFATGVIDKSRNTFKLYLTKANDSMTVIRSGAEVAAAGRGKAGGGEVAVGTEAPEAEKIPEHSTQAGGGSSEMAEAVQTAADIKAKGESLKKTYDDKKERYDNIRDHILFGKYIMPEYDKTRDGKLLKIQVEAYKEATDASAPILDKEQGNDGK